MNYSQINTCKASEFLPNLKELNSYFQVRKNVSEITNVNRLANILAIYFKSLLYYEKNSSRKFEVKIKGELFEAKLNGHNSLGETIAVDLKEISEQLIVDVIGDLTKRNNIESFKHGIIVLNSILITPKIPAKYKISILNGENKVLLNNWSALVKALPEKLALDTIKTRKNLIFQILKSPLTHFPKGENFNENIEALHNAYELYIKTLIKIHIFNNHYVELFTSLYEELKYINKITDNKYIRKERLIGFLIIHLVLRNNLFQVERKDKIREVLSEYYSYITHEIAEEIKQYIDFSPEDFELNDLTVGIENPDFSGHVLSEIKTVISFVLPYKLNVDNFNCELKNGIKFEAENTQNLFSDPIFAFLEELEGNINGMPLTFLSDAIGNLNNSSVVHLTLDEFYHPDFDIIDNKIHPINTELEDAKRGGKYYPHKDLILEKILELYNEGKSPFNIDIKKINSNIISNYLVTHLSKENTRIHHKLFTITNFNSYFNAKNKFNTNLNKLYFDEDIYDIREFLFETKIGDKKAFLEFCFHLLVITLKKSIEYGGLHKAFWEGGSEGKFPIAEPQAQPIIFNHLRFIAELKGIRLSRETIASDGSLDFHFSYNKNDILMNVCVELKNAHHGNIEHGIKTQLPLYIRDVGNREGVFLVLWYKSESFRKPTKFRDISELVACLQENIPGGYRIKPLVIDCTNKVSPSLKSASARLKINNHV